MIDIEARGAEAWDRAAKREATLHYMIEAEGHALGSAAHDARFRELEVAGEAWLLGFETRRPEIDARVEAEEAATRCALA